MFKRRSWYPRRRKRESYQTTLYLDGIDHQKLSWWRCSTIRWLTCGPSGAYCLICSVVRSLSWEADLKWDRDVYSRETAASLWALSIRRTSSVRMTNSWKSSRKSPRLPEMTHLSSPIKRPKWILRSLK